MYFRLFDSLKSKCYITSWLFLIKKISQSAYLSKKSFNCVTEGMFWRHYKLNEYLEVFVPPKCGVQICQSWKIQTHCLLWVTKLISLKLKKKTKLWLCAISLCFKDIYLYVSLKLVRFWWANWIICDFPLCCYSWVIFNSQTDTNLWILCRVSFYQPLELLYWTTY